MTTMAMPEYFPPVVLRIAQPLAVIGPRTIWSSNKGQSTNKDFPQGQVSSFVTTWTLNKQKT